MIYKESKQIKEVGREKVAAKWCCYLTEGLRMACGSWKSCRNSHKRIQQAKLKRLKTGKLQT